MLVKESTYFGLQINNLGSLLVCVYGVPVWLDIFILNWCAPYYSARKNFLFICLVVLVIESTDTWLILRIPVLPLSDIINFCTQL
jgi:hypothetical protein